MAQNEILQAFQNIIARSSDHYYRPDQIDQMIKDVRHWFRFSVNKGEKLFNVPAAFDIETSSFYTQDGHKAACMYVWMLGIFGAVMVGRTWSEFIHVINRLSEILQLNEKKRFIIYVHNLGYEFQWMRKYFAWPRVFAMDTRKPIYAITDNGIEFRCSYLLSGYSLEKLSDQLTLIPISKKVGDLDYSLIRHSKTPLTDKEIGYCLNDVRVVMAYIAERIIQDGGITKIPITKTGYIRHFVRKVCFHEAETEIV